MVNPDWIPPRYLSPSQIGSILTCGEQFRLTRVEKAPERPMWGGIGGSAVHRLTEDLDLGKVGDRPIEDAWLDYWNECLDEAKARNPEFDPEEYYRSGRASKDWPDKENPDWWAANGPKFVKSWQQWREHSGLALWEYPDGDGVLQPAIELEVWAHSDDDRDLSVRSIIDRVFIDDAGALFIVDLKSGSHTDPWPRQLALNNLGLDYTHGVQAAWGGFWKARKGGVEGWSDLSVFSNDWLWSQVEMAKKIRDQQLFVAQPGNLCANACGVRQWCVAMGGTPFFRKQDATLTQSKENQ